MYVIILVLCLKYSRSVYLSFEWNMNLFLIVKLSWSVITCKGVSPQVVSGLIHTLRPLLIACSPRGFPCHLTRGYMQYICGAQLCQELISARSRSHQHVLMGWLLVVHPSCIHLWTSYRLIGVSQNPILGQSQPTIYLFALVTVQLIIKLRITSLGGIQSSHLEKSNVYTKVRCLGKCFIMHLTL